MARLRHLGHLLYRAAVHFDRDRGFDYAATISYFALLSVLPLTILLVALGAAVVGSVDAAENGVRLLLHDLVRLLGPDVFSQARKLGSQATRLEWPFLLLSLWTASKVFSKMEAALDHVFRVEQRRSYPLRKIFAFGLVALLALALLVWMVVSGAMASLDRILESTALAGAKSNPLYLAVNNALSRYLIPWWMSVFTFGFIYRLVPARTVPVSAAAWAGLVAGSFWEILKNGFTVYLARFANYAKTYGALEAVVVFIIWINLSCVLLLWGGEVAALLSGAKPLDERQN